MKIHKTLMFFAALIFTALIFTASLAAQETKQSEAATDTKNLKESIAELSKTNESTTAEITKNEFRTAKTEKITETANLKTLTQSEQEPDDDTMMGVMGKGTDRIKLGGHVGFVVPIVARGNGVTTNVGDRFVFGFPVGLTLKTKRNIAIDFEFIPTFNTGRDFVLTIHPGIIYGFKKKYAVGVRAAYDAGAGSFGFTPLVSRGFKINEKVGFFIEADFPIRSNYRPYQDHFGSIAFAMHAGFGF